MSALALAPRPEAVAQTHAEIVSIAPDTAQRWLAANTNNRVLRPTVVSRYARDMASGNWILNGESIKLATDGAVLDGQHRLQAIVLSGATIESIVVFDLPNEAQETVDRGLGRNIADALRLRGEVNVNVLAGAIAQAVVIQSPTPSKSDFWPSTTEALNYLGAHPEIRESVLVGDHLRSVIGYPATTAAALHHLFGLLNREQADAFFASLMDGANLTPDSPILRLREIMLRELTAQRRMPRHRLWALTIKAWNAWRQGQPLQILKWKTGGSKPESFPTPR